MSSLRRTLSSRANGCLSRGPATAEGKLRSSRNAISHGFLSDCVVLPGESREGFEDVLTQHLERFCPVDDVEGGMVEEMAASHWRMRRAWAIENVLLEDELASAPGGDDLRRIAAAFRKLAASPELALLYRYETRLHLTYHRALQNFLLLRTAGGPDQPGPVGQALGLPTQPSPDLPTQPSSGPSLAPAASEPGRIPSPPVPAPPSSSSENVPGPPLVEVLAHPCTPEIPNEPSPISEHSPVARPESLAGGTHSLPMPPSLCRSAERPTALPVMPQPLIVFEEDKAA
ncbi:MAG: hypothetical protein LAQ69_03885 [Acidobacteriia bacterium]|nr:hypothetical protein [Terriglobia bacterium]